MTSLERNRAEQQLSGLLESAPDAIVVTSADGEIVVANARAEAVFGFTRDELIGSSVELLMPERKRQAHAAFRKEYVSDPQPRHGNRPGDFTARRKDGSEFPAEITLNPIQTDDGLLVSSAIRDVTERRRAEEATARLAALVGSSPDAIIGLTVEGTIDSWNAGAERLYGYTREMAIGRPITILNPPEELESREHVNAALAGETVKFETVDLTRDGDRVEVGVTISPVRDSTGAIIGVSCLAQDNGERKRAERELERLADATEHSNDAVVSIDLGGRVRNWNQGAERVYGYAAEEAIGRDVRELMMLTDEPSANMARVLTGESGYRYESRRRRKDGTIIDALTTITPWRVDGQVVGVTGVTIDVTERKRAVRELARLAQAAEHGTDAVISIDLQARVRHWNPGAERLYGFSAEEAIGKTLFELTVFTDEPRDQIARMLAGQPAYQYETRRRRKDGTIIDVLITISPWQLDGQVVGVTGISIDLTERKRVERAREQAIADLQDAQRIAAVGSWAWDPSTDQASWSAQMYEIFGRDEREGPAAGEQFFGYVHPDDRARVSEGYSRAFGGGAFELDYRIVSGGGEPRVLHARVREDPSSPGCCLGTVQDVTDQRAAEAALRDAEDRFRHAFEEAPIGMALISLEERLERANRALGEVLRRPPGDLEDVSLRELIHPDDVERALEALRAVATGEGGHLVGELRMIAPAGATVEIALHATMLRFRTAQPDRLLCQFQDLTALKRLERQREQAARLESLGQLAGGVAHDFNNLLGVMINFAAFAAEQMPAESPAVQDIDEIRRAGQRAAELTRQLLTFSRQETVRPEPLDLNEIVADTERLLRRTLGEHVTLTTSLAPTLDVVLADRGHIEQVLVNLAVNARDAMPNGGELRIETANVDLDEDFARGHPDTQAGPHVCLAVADSGVGMPREVADRAFDPFFTTKPAGQGTGLGLATVYGIVKGAGGTISLYSEPGHGTVCRVHLPVAPGAERRPPRTAASGAQSGRGERVLLVEDESAMRQIAARILEAGGYSVAHTGSPIEALSLIEHADAFDLLLTDVVMPEMLGTELGVRVAEIRPDLPILYMSGYIDPLIGARYQISDPELIVRKPFSREDLLARVRDALARTTR